jgi:hypothetical protein
VSIELAYRNQSNVMHEIVGSPYIDNYLYSKRLAVINWSFHLDLFVIHSWDWTLAANRFCLIMISHELQAFKIYTGWECPGSRLSRRAETGVQILSIQPLFMEIGSHNPF